jgi:hypothetical protein
MKSGTSLRKKLTSSSWRHGRTGYAHRDG